MKKNPNNLHKISVNLQNKKKAGKGKQINKRKQNKNKKKITKNNKF